MTSRSETRTANASLATPPEAVGDPQVFFTQQQPHLLETRRLGRVLDLACGRGRHAFAAAAAGLDVLAVDRDAAALEVLRSAATTAGLHARIETRCVDLEAAGGPDLADERFGAILVFRYLHRPLAAWIEQRLAPGGLLLYETFTTRQRALGWGPSRDAFLLRPNELPSLFPRLEVLVYAEGPSADARPAESARLLARRPSAGGRPQPDPEATGAPSSEV